MQEAWRLFKFPRLAAYGPVQIFDSSRAKLLCLSKSDFRANLNRRGHSVPLWNFTLCVVSNNL